MAMSFLHTGAFLPDANVLPNLSVGHALDELMDLGESFAADRQVKLFAGYSGWSPGQLEDEMQRNAWLTHPATHDLVFAPDIGGLWVKLMRQKGWKNRLLAEIPDDPSLN
jgi:putative transcriptional regulator